jgi:hypothetical protein
MVRNPFVARGMIKSKKGFWGRNSESETIYSLLLDSEEEPQSIAIVGLRKIGKSSLLYKIAHKRGAPSMYADQLDRTAFVMLSMQAMTSASTEQFFAMTLAELRRCDATVGEMLSTLSLGSAAGSDQLLIQLLRRMDSDEYLLVLILDEFECAAVNPCFNKSFFDLLRSMAQQWRLAFIVATQTDLDQLWDKSLISSLHSSPFFNFFQTLTLGGFRDAEMEEYLKTVSHRAGVPFGDIEIGIISDVGGLHPFFINVAAYHVFQILTQYTAQGLSDREAVWRQITRDPTVYSNFEYYWQNLTPSRRHVLIEAASGQLSKPFAPDRRVDLDWLERMGLIRRHGDGDFELFSPAFHEFVSEASHKVPESELEVSQGNTIQELISESESVDLEFKSSLRWDYHQRRRNEALELAAIKTLVAFLNTDGGTLIIGVKDDGDVLGLDKDYRTLGRKNRDGFGLYLTQLVSDRLGVRFCQYIHPTFHDISGCDVCKIDVEISPEPVYVGEDATFYIRTHNSTQKLNTREAFEYIRRHWAW